MTGIGRRRVLAGGVSVLLSLAFWSTVAADDGLRGFTSQEAAGERQWEEKLKSIPQPDRLRETMKASSEEPHHAGGPGSRKVAQYILSQHKSWGLNAWIEEHEALMPMPLERELELLAPVSYRAELREPSFPEDEDSSDAGQLPPFNAYSTDGEVTGELVYVNYGVPEDYERLAELGVDVRGRIVIARYGQSWRGIKAKLAWEHGAAACLIYSDPQDDGYRRGDVYPEGPYRPWKGVQRGSIMDMPIHPGDPLTPGWGAEKGGRKLDVFEARTLVKIPVLPISYEDAKPFLENLRGPVAPRGWQGALPLTYHIGPGPSEARLKVTFDWKVRPLYNVLARVDGAVFPDEWIVYGNHHDAWVNGASDPTSGNVALMETARALAELTKQGWKPKRTIVFASWDGEEWGLLGSTEWAEKHAAELREKAVVYINSDSNGKGWLSAGGSHSLQAFVNEVARDIADPESGKSLGEAAREHRIEEAASEAEKNRIRSRPPIPLSALGSGSDYTAFLDHLNIASLNLSFEGAGGGGVYHSIYDSFAWYTRFSDGDFVYGKTFSQMMGTALLRLADATVLPFQFTDTATAVREYLEEIEETHKKAEGAPGLDLSPVRSALDRLHRSGEAYESALSRLAANEASRLEPRPELRRLNQMLLGAERLLGDETGLPNREWFRHQIFAPGLYTGYGVKTLPGIREAVEQKAWDEARRYTLIVAEAISRSAARVEEARGTLEALLR